MHEVYDIIFFLESIGTRGPLGPDTDIFEEAGVQGDDFQAMIGHFAQRYAVNMKSYRWYFHTNEEGGSNGIGGWLFDPPYKKVERIPVTPRMLTDFANGGSWAVNYPEHKIPRVRYDILLNQLLFFGGVIALAMVIVKNC